MLRAAVPDRPYTYTVASGSLPTGLDLATTGVLSGTPTQASNFTITVSATDANGYAGVSASYPLTVTPALQPVSLVSFSAQAQPDHSVLVTWKTAWERDNGRYVVERSEDLITFQTAGVVADVAGNSNGLNTYHFVDTSPYWGTSYYRLRQVDVDGSSRTYKAQSVVIDGQYGVYPNPVSASGFTVELDEPATARLFLYDARGQSIEFAQSVAGSSSARVVPVVRLSGGVYLLRVDERGIQRTYRLLVDLPSGQ